MDDLSAILSAGILPFIGKNVATKGGFKSWIFDGTYSPAITEEGDLFLERVPVEQFSNAMSLDFERFSLSSLETYCVALSEQHEFGSASWPLLKLYYSSFFAAHAILRGRGAGVVNLEKSHADHLTQIIQIYGDPDHVFKSGSYLITTSIQGGIGRGELSVKLKRAPEKKGVHEAFWLMFSDYLVEQAEVAIVAGLPDSKEFLLSSMALRAALLEGGGGSSWMSSIRNRINYQHDFETWLPFRKGSEASIVSKFSRELPVNNHNLEISKRKSPILAFANISCHVANINFELGNYVADRSSKGGAFGQKWRRLKSQMKIA